MTRKDRGRQEDRGPQSNVTFREPRRKRIATSADSTAINDISSFLEIIEYDENGQEEKPLPVVGNTLIKTNKTIGPQANGPTTQQQPQSSTTDESFIEIIGYVNAEEKQQPTVTDVEPRDCATTSAEQFGEESSKEADKENAQQPEEPSSLLPQKSDKPVSTFLGNSEESDTLASPKKSLVKPSPKSKKEKRGRRKKAFVKSTDPTLLKLPLASCIKSASSSSDNSSVRKSFRFADTRGEGPLCDIRMVNYEEDRRYGFRKTTVKKCMFSEVL